MHSTSQYTIFIFFGVLLALVVMFMLGDMLTPPIKKTPVAATTQVAASQSTSATDSATLTDQRAAAMLALVKQDASNITGATPAAITVISQDKVDWSSSALGCAKPGILYTEIVTPGYRMMLSYKGEVFEYHTNLDNNLQLCKDTRDQ